MEMKVVHEEQDTLNFYWACSETPHFIAALRL